MNDKGSKHCRVSTNVVVNFFNNFSFSMLKECGTTEALESKHHRFSTNFVVNFYNNFSFRIHLTTGNLVLVGYHNSSISVFHITPKEIIHYAISLQQFLQQTTTTILLLVIACKNKNCCKSSLQHWC